MIEKSQVNTQTNKKGKEHSKISKCARRREKYFCVSKIKKESIVSGKSRYEVDARWKKQKDTINKKTLFAFVMNKSVSNPCYTRQNCLQVSLITL